jgi:hypothetical protein
MIMDTTRPAKEYGQWIEGRMRVSSNVRDSTFPLCIGVRSGKDDLFGARCYNGRLEVYIKHNGTWQAIWAVLMSSGTPLVKLSIDYKSSGTAYYRIRLNNVLQLTHTAGSMGVGNAGFYQRSIGTELQNKQLVFNVKIS